MWALLLRFHNYGVFVCLNVIVACGCGSCILAIFESCAGGLGLGLSTNLKSLLSRPRSETNKRTQQFTRALKSGPFDERNNLQITIINFIFL